LLYKKKLLKLRLASNQGPNADEKNIEKA